MISVSAGVIRKKNKILIGRRAPNERASGLWEFPGGKMEQGETPEECLKRELMEELGIKADIGTLFTKYEYKYPNVTYQLYFYFVDNFSGKLKYSAHDKLEWVSIDEFTKYDFLPGDQPVLDLLSK
ncbi:MAG: 8-oxo-dGTP diphosphatase MutT [Candidatus Marinimicrobia bacterium]|nr:8-oxo-dGTP diphosphatase MutT [Candidatus Neomarinimicrobiota bacterium]